MPISSKQAIGKQFNEIVELLTNSGFANIVTEEIKHNKKGIFDKENSISLITIDGKATFQKDEWVKNDILIKVQYKTFDI